MVEADTVEAAERQRDAGTARKRRAVTPTAFATLYDDQFTSMVRLAVLLTGNHHVATDIVQDAFVKLHLKWASVRTPIAYLNTSVVNGARSFHRRRGRRGEVLLTEQLEKRLSSGSGDVQDATADHSFDHTLSTLDTLSSRERACVVLKFYVGLPEREIAAVVRCRPGSVGPTVQRALRKLRSEQ